MFLDPACDRCGSTKLRLSRRRTIPDQLLSAFLVPCRCITCEWRGRKLRFLDLGLQRNAPQPEQVLTVPHSGK